MEAAAAAAATKPSQQRLPDERFKRATSKESAQLASSSRKSRRLVMRLFQGLKVRFSALILLACLLGQVALGQQSAGESRVPANHRMESDEPLASNATSSASSGRQSRQYDSLGSSSAASYTQPAGSDSSGASYLGASGSSPAMSQSAAAAAAAAYGAASADLGTYSMPSYHEPSLMHPQQQQHARAGLQHHMAYGPAPHAHLAAGGGALGPMFAGATGGPGGLLAGSAPFPLMAKGFDLAEIVCTAIAVAIGAVIVGAPFILLYLFVMNQMQGGGGGGPLGGLGGGPGAGGGGSISLTGPSSSTNVSGRKKRQTSFPDVLIKQLSPLVNSEQVAQSFKMLMSALAKYSQ